MENNNHKPVNRIKKLRLKRGYTLADIASRMHVSEGTVQRWESGKTNNIKQDKLVALARLLETSVPYLIGWSDIDTITQTDNSSRVDYIIKSPDGNVCGLEVKTLPNRSKQIGQIDTAILLLNKIRTGADGVENGYSELIQGYSKLTKENQQMVINFINTILSQQENNDPF